MEPIFRTLEIEGFRAFRRLKIDGLGRVNLVTGRNNTGKSSLLEAVRLLAFGGSASILSTLLMDREMDLTEDEDGGGPSENAVFVQSLFHGFPQSVGGRGPHLEIFASGNRQAIRIRVAQALYYEERGADGTRRLTPQQMDLFGREDGIPVLEVNVGENRRAVPLGSLRRASRRYGLPPEEPRLPCVYVNPYAAEQTASLGPLWDRIALSDAEKDVVEALRIIDPSISAVSMVGSGWTRPSRTAIVRAEGIPRPVPLRTFGDGLNRLFALVLSVVNAKDGLLLIDEFENGIHHSAQLEAWRMVFRLARQLDIQVLATSHSWDSVEAFQVAASESPDEGVLIRLSRQEGDIVPTLFREDELAVVTRDRIEVR